MGREDGKIMFIPCGNELREPSFYSDKCDTSRDPATRAAYLLEVKLLHLQDDTKGKGKTPAQEEVEVRG